VKAVGIKFLNRAPPPVPPVVEASPESAQQEYTILTALEEWDGKKFNGQVLMLVNDETGSGYMVLAYDKQTHRVKLKGNHGELLNPVVTAREAKLYTPVWR
jgi:hypothetical protein